MSSPAVEAKSLSALTALAYNPPAYPRNPTHVKHEPLVLYIARVPGSRDVFLSPMKPRQKVVTAEDIQSSLYFVHVDQPEDARLVTPPEFREPHCSGQRPISPDPPPPSGVQRKAVPETSLPVSIQAATQRKPVPGTLAPINDFQNRQNASAGAYSQNSRQMLRPEYDHSPRRSFDSMQRGEERPPPLPRRPTHQPDFTGTSLTVIRRDPASSAQWNVARIDDPPVLDVSSSNLNEPSSSKKVGAPMYIEVFNPGYSKFLHSEGENKPPLISRNTDLPVRPYNAPVGSQLNIPEQPSKAESQGDSNVFRRRLWMEGSRYTNGGFGHRKLGSQDLGRQNPSNSYEFPRGPSVDHRPPETFTQNDRANNVIQNSERQSTFRGYVFMSPWNGRCEFITGMGGGTLKCRHVISGPQGATPSSVSELRFNLPSSSKATTPRSEDSKRSSFFHRPRHSRQNSSMLDSGPNSRGNSVEDVRNSFDRMDLSLGQEFAGGGFGGKQAKLGKLIIEDEGLKMVDLLVAANVALWWRAYERGDAKSRSGRVGSF